METRIDRFGRIVIPKKLRERFGLRTGDSVRLTEMDGRIALEPGTDAPMLARKRDVLVYTGAPCGDVSGAANGDGRAD